MGRRRKEGGPKERKEEPVKRKGGHWKKKESQRREGENQTKESQLRETEGRRKKEGSLGPDKWQLENLERDEANAERNQPVSEEDEEATGEEVLSF